jgi:hypothetical protein
MACRSKDFLGAYGEKRSASSWETSAGIFHPGGGLETGVTQFPLLWGFSMLIYLLLLLFCPVDVPLDSFQSGSY